MPDRSALSGRSALSVGSTQSFPSSVPHSPQVNGSANNKLSWEQNSSKLDPVFICYACFCNKIDTFFLLHLLHFVLLQFFANILGQSNMISNLKLFHQTLGLIGSSQKLFKFLFKLAW